MTATNLIMLFAILLGPILAVITQMFIGRMKEQKKRRFQIFRTLMATRSTRISTEHVEALNSIDIEFCERSKKCKDIQTAWKVYHNHLCDNSKREIDVNAWSNESLDLFIELLKLMADYFGYSFDKVDLKKNHYTPMAQDWNEVDLFKIRTYGAQVLSGEKPLGVVIQNPMTEQEQKAKDKKE